MERLRGSWPIQARLGGDLNEERPEDDLSGGTMKATRHSRLGLECVDVAELKNRPVLAYTRPSPPVTCHVRYGVDSVEKV
jgi:hypothetical protein